VGLPSRVRGQADFTATNAAIESIQHKNSATTSAIGERQCAASPGLDWAPLKVH
jgi:hypothetical protein